MHKNSVYLTANRYDNFDVTATFISYRLVSGIQSTFQAY